MNRTTSIFCMNEITKDKPLYVMFEATILIFCPLSICFRRQALPLKSHALDRMCNFFTTWSLLGMGSSCKERETTHFAMKKSPKRHATHYASRDSRLDSISKSISSTILRSYQLPSLLIYIIPPMYMKNNVSLTSHTCIKRQKKKLNNLCTKQIN